MKRPKCSFISTILVGAAAIVIYLVSFIPNAPTWAYIMYNNDTRQHQPLRLGGLAGSLQNLSKGRYDVCFVGSGLSSEAISERYATRMNYSVLALEKRNPACRDRFSNRNPVALKAFYDHIDLTCPIVRTWHVCPARPSMTDRVAVTNIQSGYDVALYSYIIRATMRRLGPRWALQIFYGTDNIKDVLAKSLDHPSYVVWTPLTIKGKHRAKITHNEFNWMMLSPEFWRAVSHEHVLLFEGHTLLLKHGCIESFLNHSLLGGNGGFSLRRKSSMLAAVENIELRSACPLSDPEGCPCPGQRRELQLCEDLLFTQTLSRMYGDSPNRSSALGFSVETQEHPDPCGFHAPWKHVGPAETQRMLSNVDMTHPATTKCGHVSQHLIALASYHNSRALVYRCRPFDDCGGLGDRFAGILGAAMLSLSLGRSLKIDWPDLQHAFMDKENIWSYDEKWLNVSRVHEYKSPPSSPHKSSFTDLSADVGLLSMLNTFRFLDNPSQQSWAPSKRVLFFHSNRACSQSQYQAWKSQQGVLANQKAPLLEVYRCIFDTLFAIKPSFSDQIVPLISDPRKLTLGHHLSLARSENMFTIAIQVRISDEDIRGSAKREIELSWVNCVNACVKLLSQGKATIVYVMSNSKELSRNMLHHIKLAANYSKVFAPLISGEVHTNAPEFKNKTDLKTNSKLAFTNAMRDWILLRNVHVLIYSTWSGFPTSAALFSDSTQKHVDLGTCKEITRDRDENVYCSGRYC
jgi:hypothetical protein